MWTKIKNLKKHLKRIINLYRFKRTKANITWNLCERFMLLFKELKQSFLLAGFIISLWIIEGLIYNTTICRVTATCKYTKPHIPHLPYTALLFPHRTYHLLITVYTYCAHVPSWVGVPWGYGFGLCPQDLMQGLAHLCSKKEGMPFPSFLTEMSALGISLPARPFDQPLLSYQVIAIELTAHRAPGWAGNRAMEKERQQEVWKGDFGSSGLALRAVWRKACLKERTHTARAHPSCTHTTGGWWLKCFWAHLPFRASQLEAEMIVFALCIPLTGLT